MYPVLFKIGDFEIATYAVLIVIGLIGAVLLFKYLSGRFKLSDNSYNFYSFIVIISIVVGFLFAFLFQAFYNFIDEGKWRFGGVTFMGGLIGGVLAFVAITWIFGKKEVKKDFWKTANLMAPCLVGAHCFGRIGCFFAGCCYGTPTDSFLGIQFTTTDQKVVPTQLLEAIFLAVLCAVMLFLLFKYGILKPQMLIYLYSYAVFRFIIEFFRGDYRGSFIPGISPSQFQSILMALAGILLTVYILRFKREPFDGKGWSWLTRLRGKVSAAAPGVETSAVNSLGAENGAAGSGAKAFADTLDKEREDALELPEKPEEGGVPLEDNQEKSKIAANTGNQPKEGDEKPEEAK